MAKEKLNYYYNDINWYFVDRFNRLCVAASGGGILPPIVVKNERNNNTFHDIVLDLPSLYEIKRNPNITSAIPGLDNVNTSAYFKGFDQLASRGLYVFDKLRIDEVEDGNYILVAHPIYDSKKDNYPVDKELLSLIPRIIAPINPQRTKAFNLISYLIKYHKS